MKMINNTIILVHIVNVRFIDGVRPSDHIPTRHPKRAGAGDDGILPYRIIQRIPPQNAKRAPFKLPRRENNIQ